MVIACAFLGSLSVTILRLLSFTGKYSFCLEESIGGAFGSELGFEGSDLTATRGRGLLGRGVVCEKRQSLGAWPGGKRRGL